MQDLTALSLADLLAVTGRAEDVSAERRAWEWARAEQGFGGNFAAWQSLGYRERMEYEAGAAGIPTA